MATTEHDYYELLGVPRNATDAEIKRAFRSLARELHPDVSDAPDAEERFREVAEAYEVLSNAERRELYDRLGHQGLRSGGFDPGHFDMGNLADIFSAFFGDDLFAGGRRASHRPAHGSDVGAETELELVEAAHGVTRQVSFQAATECGRCDGGGAEPGTEPVRCETCGGLGHVQQVSRSVFGEFVRAGTCPHCGGAGRTIEHPCTECAGAGRVLDERTVEVKIPAGIHDGQRIRVSGEGHAGRLGGRAGDVYVLVRVKPDERFVRDGDDIVSTVSLTMTQAALGGTTTVPTLEGDVELELRPGTQPGEVRVLKGKGMPVLQRFGHGDHRVLVNVLVPRHLTDEQRRALEEFGRGETERTYEADEGFFAKLKSAFR
jgi:molecular chaperone DnaJ